MCDVGTCESANNSPRRIESVADEETPSKLVLENSSCSPVCGRKKRKKMRKRTSKLGRDLECDMRLMLTPCEVLLHCVCSPLKIRHCSLIAFSDREILFLECAQCWFALCSASPWSTAKTARPTPTVQVAPQTLVAGVRIVLSVTKVRVAVRTPVRAVTGAGCPTCAPPTLLPACAHTLTVTIAPQLPAVVGVAPMANVTAATLPARRTVAAVSGTKRNALRLQGTVSYFLLVEAVLPPQTASGVQPMVPARTQAPPSTVEVIFSATVICALPALLRNVVIKPTAMTVCNPLIKGCALGARRVGCASTTTPLARDAPLVS